MKSLLTLTVPSLVLIVAGLMPSAASAQWTVIDPANLAQAITQVTKLVEQIDLIREQIDLQETIRRAADDHLNDFRQSLESKLAFDVDKYLDRHLSEIHQFDNASHVNPDAISSKTRSETEFIEYFNYHDPDRLQNYDPAEHERMLFTSINESMNEIRDARARLTTTASEIKELSRKARAASTPEERRQLQIEIDLLQAKQENEAQMLTISRADLENLLEMSSHAELTRQRNEAIYLNESLIAAGSLSNEETERHIKDVEAGLTTKGGNPKQVHLRPTFRKGQ